MTTNEKKVFHPTLGICTITEYDRKSDRITMISLDGNQSVIPYKNMDKAGVREIMDIATARLILDRIFHPAIHADYGKELSELLKMRNYSNIDMNALVEVYIYLMNWKYAERKCGMKNQECLERIQERLCDELAFVLDVGKEQLIAHLIACYENLA